MTPTTQSTLDILKDDIKRLSEADAREVGVFCVAHADRLKADADDAALRQAIALLESRGIDPKIALARLKTSKPKKPAAAKPAFVPKAGHMYQHPDNPTLKASGTGHRPGWWDNLLKAGKMPKDLGPIKDAKPVAAAS